MSNHEFELIYVYLQFNFDIKLIYSYYINKYKYI